mgnify:CR=1 FL=1
MRYLIAMLSAVVFAVAATVYLASPLATWVVARNTFDSPDAVNDLHSTVFMGANLAALLVGWLFGWVVGGWMVGDGRGSGAGRRG